MTKVKIPLKIYKQFCIGQNQVNLIKSRTVVHIQDCKILMTLHTPLLTWFLKNNFACKDLQDPLYWSQKSRLGWSRPGIGISLNKIFKSRQVFVFVSNKIGGLAELGVQQDLLVLILKIKTWLVKTMYWSWSQHNWSEMLACAVTKLSVHY